MNKSSHEEHLSQPLQTNNEQFKSAITFLTGSNGIFDKTSKIFKIYFTIAIDDDGISEIIFFLQDLMN